MSEQQQPLRYLFERHSETCPSAVVIERLHCNEKIRMMAAARVVTPAHEVPGELLLGEFSLYFVADDKHLCSVCSSTMYYYYVRVYYYCTTCALVGLKFSLYGQFLQNTPSANVFHPSYLLPWCMGQSSPCISNFYLLRADLIKQVHGSH